MSHFEDHIRRVEAALEELTEHPDRVIHELYIGFALHDCAGLADLTEEQRGTLLHHVELVCTGILCPPLAVGTAGNQVYLLVQMNPERTFDDIAQTAGAALGCLSAASDIPRWGGDYSVASLGREDAEEFASAFRNADERARALFDEGQEQE